MGILDDKTLRILRDGRVIGAMHRLSGSPTDPSDRGVKVEVRVRDKHGAQRTQRVILKRVHIG